MLIPFLTLPVIPAIVYPIAGVNSTLLITATLSVDPSVPLPKYKLASVLLLSCVSRIDSILKPVSP